MPFFSVIIPLYNKEHFIKNTLKSVLCQTFTDFEIIIVNDGSSDRSAEIIQEFEDSRIRYFFKENGGASSARNYGIERAQSNYITFIDADDYWYPFFLQEMFEYINRFSELKVFSAAIEIETSKKTFPAQYSIVKTNNCEIVNYFSASLKESVIWTSCAVFHKSVFEKVGIFDPEIKISEDTDLWIRIGLIYPVLFSWKILARYVYDANSLSQNIHYIMEESSFLKFSIQEKTNKPLKKFMDLNRFSTAIKSKLTNDYSTFKKRSNEISPENLSIRKKILLILPSQILTKLISLKSYLVTIGLEDSVFK